ncbi:ABC transporter substrate-binding protein [Plastoroseomonas hellenica]|uniref:ABC transporter substrate-binding protein n=1 Tax=Plastoroseomonas hellenica TaxID=2687306 RepID=UPI001BA7C786|nr:ABC transporter substrate-binding protein [Plastoroseomonas hellenica]MBR0641290.1 ABC transporter substrate-binding protein [Plastoroseomonas hellenica]
MRRRTVLGAAVGIAAMPAITRAQGSRVLRYAPGSDLAILDPTLTAAYVTRNHALMVFDTLYGQDNSYAPQPQMVAGHVVEDDGRRWTLTLRDGLRFHDGEAVLARDAVASIRRWGRIDAFGQALMAATDELSASDDRRILFRLKRPFPLLPNALSKVAVFCPVVMPARLAESEPGRPISEMIGSGPFRFLADERVPGSRNVYEKFTGYVPRPDGVTEFTAGPKHVHLDRVEWMTMPDSATAASALRRGEIDWWENPTVDLVPMLRRQRSLTLRVLDPAGSAATLRFNFLHPPFDKPEIRRALLHAIDQTACMNAVVGDEPSLFNARLGVFSPLSPMASDAGLEVLTAPRDPGRTRREIAAAGYNGERVVLIGASDIPAINAVTEVVADTMKRCGLNVDLVMTDWGAAVTRRLNRGPVAQGGWSAFCGTWSGQDFLNPAGHLPIRGNGQASWSGWPENPRLEALRNAWFEAPDLAEQQRLCREIQEEVWRFVTYVPLGQFVQHTAFHNSITGVLQGHPAFHNIRKG